MCMPQGYTCTCTYTFTSCNPLTDLKVSEFDYVLVVQLLHEFDLSEEVLHGAVGQMPPLNALHCHHLPVTALQCMQVEHVVFRFKITACFR